LNPLPWPPAPILIESLRASVGAALRAKTWRMAVIDTRLLGVGDITVTTETRSYNLYSTTAARQWVSTTVQRTLILGSGMGTIFSVVGLGLIMSAALTFVTMIMKQGRTPTIRFPSEPAFIAIRKERKDGRPGGEIEYKSLRELVQSRCSSLFTEFCPLWYLFKCVATISTKYLKPISNLKWPFTNHVLHIW